MRQLLIVERHSFVDVITNSSSELFVCDTDKSEEFIREFLQKCLETYNFGAGTNCSFEECFGPIEIITPESVEKFIDEYVIDWGVHNWRWEIEELPDYWQFRRSIQEKEHLYERYPYNENVEHNHRVRSRLDLEWNKAVSEWKEKNLEALKAKLIGNICIYSESDNSIPYEMFEMIENVLNAKRQHLG